jgi:hypothetical protein
MGNALLLNQLFEKELLWEMSRKAGFLRLKKGERLTGLGQGMRYVPFVLSGSICVSTLAEDGKEVPLYPIATYQTCALSLLYGIRDSTREIQLKALEEAALLVIPYTLMEDWCERFGSFKNFVRQTLLFAPPKAQVWKRMKAMRPYELGGWVFPVGLR